MPAEVKNSISHRGKSLEALKGYFISNPPNEIDAEPEAKKYKENENDKWDA